MRVPLSHFQLNFGNIYTFKVQIQNLALFQMTFNEQQLYLCKSCLLLHKNYCANLGRSKPAEDYKFTIIASKST